MNNVEIRRLNAAAMCAERGLAVDAFGAGWHVHGNGVDILIARLEQLTAADLLPLHAPLAKTSKLTAVKNGWINGDPASHQARMRT